MSDDNVLRLLTDAFLAEHAEDAARRLELLDVAAGTPLLDELPPEQTAAIVEAMAPLPAARYLAAMRPQAAAPVLEALPIDLAARIFRMLDPDVRERLLGDVPERTARAIRTLATYPDDSVAAYTETRDWIAGADWSVADARTHLQEAPQPLVYVVNRAQEVVGRVPVEKLRGAPGEQKLADLADRDVTRLRAEAKIASVQAHPAWLDADLLPVVDASSKFIGLLRHRAVRRATAGASAATPGNAMIHAIVGLSELYWTGMTTVLTGVSATRTSGEETRERSRD